MFRCATSLCHAGADAALVIAISRGVLGIELTEAGYRVCRVAPQRRALDWIRGAVPTPRGAIAIEWRGFKGEARLPVA
jgi:alpha-L-rhamnosidase